MPRHSIYIPESIESQIKACIQAMRDDGAIGLETTISGFGGKLIELGLRVYQNQQSAGDDPLGAMDVERLLLKESILARHMLEANFRTLLKVPGLQVPISPDDMVKAVHTKAEKEYTELYEGAE